MGVQEVNIRFLSLFSALQLKHTTARVGLNVERPQGGERSTVTVSGMLEMGCV